jgi:hypothetical protein
MISVPPFNVTIHGIAPYSQTRTLPKKDQPPRRVVGLMNDILIAHVWHHCQMTCSLDRNGKCSLMLCTVACDTAGKDLSSLRDISL